MSGFSLDQQEKFFRSAGADGTVSVSGKRYRLPNKYRPGRRVCLYFCGGALLEYREGQNPLLLQAVEG